MAFVKVEPNPPLKIQTNNKLSQPSQSGFPLAHLNYYTLSDIRTD